MSNQDLSVLQPLVDNTALATIDVGSLEIQASSMVVDDQLTYDMANELLGTLKSTEKSLDGERDRRFQTLKAIEGYVMGDVRTLLARVKTAGNTLKTAMLGFQREQERKRAEEQARLDREAREQREALEKQAAKAEKKGDAEKAAVLAQTAAVITAPVATSTYTGGKGVSTIKRWKARVTDKAAFLKSIVENPSFAHLVKVDESALNDLAKAMAGKLPIAGVETYQDETLARRVA